MRRRRVLAGTTAALSVLTGCIGGSSSGSGASTSSRAESGTPDATAQQPSPRTTGSEPRRTESVTQSSSDRGAPADGPTTSPLRIARVTLEGYDPRFYPGHDTVRVHNRTDRSVDPEGYTVEFDPDHRHTFSSFRVDPTADILVLSGTSAIEVEESLPPTYVRPACFADRSILAPGGGTVVLRDPTGTVVDTKSYAARTPQTLPESISTPTGPTPTPHRQCPND